MNANDPAFPVLGVLKEIHDLGLTKREIIAAMAMVGLLASWPPDGAVRPEATAKIAVAFADALIAELSKETSQ